MHLPCGQPFQAHGQLGKTLRTAGRLLGALDLKQRMGAGLARRCQRLHQLVERQLRMFLGLEQGAAHSIQQRGEALPLIDGGAQHAQGGEVAHHALGFGAGAVGQRRADAHAVGAALARQQQLEHGQHGHERGCPLRLGQAAQARAGVGGHLHPDAGTAGIALCTAWTVQRQRQGRVVIAQLLAPVVELARLFARLQPAPLPAGVIGVLHGQRRPLRGVALAACGIRGGQVFDDQADGPAVGQDVMQHDHQTMLLRIQAMQFQTQRRGAHQIERLPGQYPSPLLRAGFVQFQAHQGLELMRMNALLRLAFGILGERGAQRFVPGTQIVAGLLQRLDVQRAAQAQHTRQVVGRAVGLALPGDPQTALGQRQRRCGRARHRDHGQVGEAHAVFLEPSQEGLATLGAQLGKPVGDLMRIDTHLKPRIHPASGPCRSAARGDRPLRRTRRWAVAGPTSAR